MEHPVSLPGDGKRFQELLDNAKDWTIIHGGGMRGECSPDCIQFVPFTLLPSVVDRKNFQTAVRAQTVFNKLIHKAAHSHSFLSSALEETIKVDSFTNKLYSIYKQVREEGFKQPLSLGLLRSDYLSDWDGAYRQVEINTVAVSLSALSTVISSTHKYVLEELGHGDKTVNLPENRSLEGFCKGIIQAWELFNDPKSVILFVVEEATVNICDQRLLEYRIREMCPGVVVVRRKFSELEGSLSLSEEGHLVLGDSVRVAVVYYRAGYDPDHYRSPTDWYTRLTIERSTAIKCPSIQYHLAGTKKVQQILAKPGRLEGLLESYEEVQLARSMFVAIHSLDYDEEGDEGARLAMVNPSRFVLKPQREGGGNNVYGEEVALALESLEEGRPGWVLMERIRPRPATATILRPAQPAPSPSAIVSELGIYGVLLGSAEKILVNDVVGQTLRTKLSSSDEGGVASGTGSLDSPYLV